MRKFVSEAARKPASTLGYSIRTCPAKFLSSGEAGSEQLQAQLSVLDEPNLPNPFQVITDSDIEEANDTNVIDPGADEDIDIEL